MRPQHPRLVAPARAADETSSTPAAPETKSSRASSSSHRDSFSAASATSASARPTATSSSEHRAATTTRASSSSNASAAGHSATSVSAAPSATASSSSSGSDQAGGYTTAVMVGVAVIGLGLLTWILYCFRQRGRRRAKRTTAGTELWGSSGGLGGAARNHSISRSERRRGSRRLDDLVDHGAVDEDDAEMRGAGTTTAVDVKPFAGIIVHTGGYDDEKARGFGAGYGQGEPTYPPPLRMADGAPPMTPLTPLTPMSEPPSAGLFSPLSPDPLLRMSGGPYQGSGGRSPVEATYSRPPRPSEVAAAASLSPSRSPLALPGTHDEPASGATLGAADQAALPSNRISNGLLKYSPEAPARAGQPGGGPSDFAMPAQPPYAYSPGASATPTTAAPSLFDGDDSRRLTDVTAATSVDESDKAESARRKKDTIMGLLEDGYSEADDAPPMPPPPRMPAAKPPPPAAIFIPPASTGALAHQSPSLQPEPLPPSPLAVTAGPPTLSLANEPNDRPLSNIEDLLNTFSTQGRKEAAMSTSAFGPNALAFRQSAAPAKAGHARGRSNSSSAGTSQPPLPIPAPPARLISTGHDPVPPSSRSPNRGSVLSPVLESPHATRHPESEYDSTRPFSSSVRESMGDGYSIQAFDLEETLDHAKPPVPRHSVDAGDEPEWLKSMLEEEPAPGAAKAAPSATRPPQPSEHGWLPPRPGPMESQSRSLPKGSNVPGLGAPPPQRAPVDSFLAHYG